MKEGYTTKTLTIAAYLYAKGIQLIKTDKKGKEVYFEFFPKEEAEKLVSQYFAGTALVNARDLFARLNDLKDLIFSNS